jgi:hypothetical protein
LLQYLSATAPPSPYTVAGTQHPIVPPKKLRDVSSLLEPGT